MCHLLIDPRGQSACKLSSRPDGSGALSEDSAGLTSGSFLVYSRKALQASRKSAPAAAGRRNFFCKRPGGCGPLLPPRHRTVHDRQGTLITKLGSPNLIENAESWMGRGGDTEPHEYNRALKKKAARLIQPGPSRLSTAFLLSQRRVWG